MNHSLPLLLLDVSLLRRQSSPEIGMRWLKGRHVRAALKQ
jgi:hypothetical protein